MARAQFADNWVSTLSASYTIGGPSLTVTDASLLPANGEFYVLVQSEGLHTTEVFKVTARSGNVLTVVAAQANTIASNHAAGATIQGAILTTGAIAQMRADMERVLTASQFAALTAGEYADGDVVWLSDAPTTKVRSAGAWQSFALGGDYAPGTPSINAQTGTSYTLVASDNGKILTLGNAAAITLTVPAGLGAGFSVVFVQLGAGKVTVTASGTTVVQRQSFAKTAGQYAVASLFAYAANTFALSGDVAA